MLSVHSALPVSVGGRGSPVIYIDTEGAFSAERSENVGFQTGVATTYSWFVSAINFSTML